MHVSSDGFKSIMGKNITSDHSGLVPDRTCCIYTDKQIGPELANKIELGAVA